MVTTAIQSINAGRWAGSAFFSVAQSSGQYARFMTPHYELVLSCVCFMYVFTVLNVVHIMYCFVHGTDISTNTACDNHVIVM